MQNEIESVAQLLSKDKNISQAIVFGSMAQDALKHGSDIDENTEQSMQQQNESS